MAMQELPHRFPLVQCGPFVSAAPPLRQELMNCLRASPLMPLACVLQSFIFLLLSGEGTVKLARPAGDAGLR
jgi:hypothetical protein